MRLGRNLKMDPIGFVMISGSGYKIIDIGSGSSHFEPKYGNLEF